MNMADTAKQEQTEKDSYVVNPPLVHSLDISADGLIAAAGLENGKVRFTSCSELIADRLYN